MRAVRTLEADPAFENRLESEIIGMSTEKGIASNALYDWGVEKHGLVVLDAEGKAVIVLKGHSWGEGDDAKAVAVLKERIGALGAISSGG